MRVWWVRVRVCVCGYTRRVWWKRGWWERVRDMVYIWMASAREKQSICVSKCVERDAQKDRTCSKLQPLTVISNKRGWESAINLKNWQQDLTNPTQKSPFIHECISLPGIKQHCTLHRSAIDDQQIKVAGEMQTCNVKKKPTAASRILVMLTYKHLRRVFDCPVMLTAAWTRTCMNVKDTQLFCHKTSTLTLIKLKCMLPTIPLEKMQTMKRICVCTERNGYIPVHAQSHTVTLTVAETSNSRSTWRRVQHLKGHLICWVGKNHDCK